MPLPKPARAVPVLFDVSVSMYSAVDVFELTSVIETAPPVDAPPVIETRVTLFVSNASALASFVPMTTVAPVVLPPSRMSPPPLAASACQPFVVSHVRTYPSVTPLPYGSHTPSVSFHLSISPCAVPGGANWPPLPVSFVTILWIG